MELLVLLSGSVLAVNAQEMLDYDSLSFVRIDELYKAGKRFSELNNNDTAMGYYIILAGRYNISMSESDKYLCALACASAGETYFKNGNYQQAFEMNFKGIQICEENGFEKLLALFYKNAGNVYNVYNDPRIAIRYYLKGLDIAEKYDDYNVKVRLLSNLTSAYTFCDSIDMAKEYYKRMIDFSYKDSLFEFHKYFNYGLIKVFENKKSESVEPFRKAIKYALEHNLEPQYITSVYGDLAQIYYQLNQTDSALYYYNLNEKYTVDNNLPYYQMMTLRSLYDVYRELGYKQKAREYKMKYLELSDSVVNKEKFNQLKNTQLTYEFDRNFKKISRLTQEKAEKEKQVVKQRKMIFLTGLVSLCFGILMVILYLQNKKLYNAYWNLYQKNNELVKSEKINRTLRDECAVMMAESVPFKEEQTDNDRKISENKTTDQTEQSDDKNQVRISIEQREILLKNIVDIMENTEEYCDSDFSLEKLSSLVGSNTKYVSQIINDTFNKNFRSFVNEYRIKEACSRLADSEVYGNLTIQAIGESVGYKSRTNFTEIFKKNTGLTPAMYQKMAREASRGL